jgi:dihydrofolate reductase
MLSLIIAVDKEWGIGNNNSLLFHFSSDLKRFKELTTGSNIVMGRKTWDSLPKKLPNRTNIVISRTNNLERSPDYIFDSIEDVLNLATESKKETWIIGGAEIARMFMPHISKIELTMVDAVRESDTKLSFLEDYLPNFKAVSLSKHKELDKISDKEVSFEYITYKIM